MSLEKAKKMDAYGDLASTWRANSLSVVGSMVKTADGSWSAVNTESQHLEGRSLSVVSRVRAGLCTGSCCGDGGSQ